MAYAPLDQAGMMQEELLKSLSSRFGGPQGGPAVAPPAVETASTPPISADGGGIKAPLDVPLPGIVPSLPPDSIPLDKGLPAPPTASLPPVAASGRFGPPAPPVGAMAGRFGGSAPPVSIGGGGIGAPRPPQAGGFQPPAIGGPPPVMPGGMPRPLPLAQPPSNIFSRFMKQRRPTPPMQPPVRRGY
jgi:hypothetical protein